MLNKINFSHSTFAIGSHTNKHSIMQASVLHSNINKIEKLQAVN